MRPHVLILLISLLFVCQALPAAEETARVVGVSDTVLKDRTSTRIRLHGIDAPESGQDFGNGSKQLASELAFGKDVAVRPVDKDRFGRTVAVIVLPDGRSLNVEMVRQGMAWWYRKYAPNDHELAKAESEAKAAGYLRVGDYWRGEE